ncbi:hypothetical protein V1264_023973 [Littorina saxatilis]|uniref:Uncharacterized protein n=1 Tax=Littorina saxatilis TaxID=31220 RepID=A0AAN9GBU7_9CAEN
MRASANFPSVPSNLLPVVSEDLTKPASCACAPNMVRRSVRRSAPVSAQAAANTVFAFKHVIFCLPAFTQFWGRGCCHTMPANQQPSLRHTYLHCILID